MVIIMLGNIQLSKLWLCSVDLEESFEGIFKKRDHIMQVGMLHNKPVAFILMHFMVYEAPADCPHSSDEKGF